MAAVQPWCRVEVVGPDGTVLAGCLLEGPGEPDLGAVDRVARLALVALRLGGAISLTEVSAAMRALIHLAGLPVEVEREAEGGKEPLGVKERQEEAHPGDPAP